MHGYTMIQVCPDICRYTDIHTRDTLTQKQSNTLQNIVKCVTCTWTQEQITGKKMKISMDSPHTGWPPQHMIRCTRPPANSALACSSCRSVFHNSMGRGNGASSTLGLSVSVYYLESCFFPNSPNFSLNRVHMTFILEKLAFHPRRTLSIPKTTISLLLSCQLYTHLFSTICSTFTTIYSMYLLHARQTLGHGQGGHSQMK